MIKGGSILARELRSDESGFTSEFNYLIDEFDELQDLRWSELQFLNEYKELKMKKNDGSPVDQVRLDELELIFENKIVTSARWNKFQNALVGMQTFIKDEVEGYVDIKQTEFQEYIDRFSKKGLYNPEKLYQVNNYVDFDDGTGLRTFLCIKETVGNNPLNTTYWQELTIKGVQGERGLDGLNVKFKGSYDSTVAYQKDEGVQFGGLLFVSMVNENLNNEPDMAMGTEFWERALDVTVTTTKWVGVRSVTTETAKVNFVIGQITDFNATVDSIEVYMNSVRLTQGYDYTVNNADRTIRKKNGMWLGSVAEPIFFEFVVTKNIMNNLVFSDGSAIQDGTIFRQKLSDELKNGIVSVGVERPEDGASLWYQIVE